MPGIFETILAFMDKRRECVMANCLVGVLYVDADL